MRSYVVPVTDEPSTVNVSVPLPITVIPPEPVTFTSSVELSLPVSLNPLDPLPLPKTGKVYVVPVTDEPSIVS